MRRIFRVSDEIQLGEWEITETLEDLLQNYTFTEQEQEAEVIKMHPERLKSYLAVRILAQKMIPEAVFIKDEYGKPFVNHSIGNRNIHLSWSHSGKYAAVLVSSHESAGIDIEKIDSRILRIKDKFCNKTDLSSHKPLNAIETLLVIWGAKESMYKFYGKKEVDFKLHMTVRPFIIQESGSILGEMHLPNYQRKFKLNYEIKHDRILVYILEVLK